MIVGMTLYPNVKGTNTALGRAVSAEVRAQLAARRSSGKKLAELIGRSQNYVAKRLRDEAPFTLDDVDDIVDALFDDRGPEQFISDAMNNFSEDAYASLEMEEDKANGAVSERPATFDPRKLGLAAQEDYSDDESDQ